MPRDQVNKFCLVFSNDKKRNTLHKISLPCNYLVFRLEKSVVVTPQKCASRSSTLYAVCPLNSADGCKLSIKDVHSAELAKIQDQFLSSKSSSDIKCFIRPSSPLLADISMSKENSSPDHLIPVLFSKPTRPLQTRQAQSKSNGNITAESSSTVKTTTPRLADKDQEKTFPNAKNSAASSFFGSHATKKRNVTQKPRESPSKSATNQVGNADDFVGDEESDEEKENHVLDVETEVVNMNEEEPEEEPVKIVKKSRRKKKAEDEETELDPQSETTKGAMDAFAVVATKSSSSQSVASSGKRRRQKHVERTSVDVDGYLKTETVCIMEDIPTDEEEGESKNTAPIETKSSLTAKTSNASKKPVAKSIGKKKQMGLNAFFTKK